MKPSPATLRALLSLTFWAIRWEYRIERGNTALVAAVDDVEKQDAVALGWIGGPEHIDIGHVFDATSGVLGGKPDVLNDALAG
jgi:hypothetical protein